MYILTLEVNQRCNLRCKYCYIKEKSNSKMKIDDAIKSIELGVQQAIKHKDKKLVIDFIGGEASLDFNLIKEIVKFSKLICKRNFIDVHFITTTNATSINKEIVEFYIENKFSLKVSLDGNKKVNDLNRIYTNGNGSHDSIIDKLSLLKDYENCTNKIVQVTNVITKNNYINYFDSLIYLTNNLRFKLIDTAIDFYSIWNEDEYKIIEENIYKSFDYFTSCYFSEKKFMWSFINQVYRSLNKVERLYSCGAGIVSLYVNSNGEFYSCPVSMDQSNKLGDTNNGLDSNKVEILKNIQSIDNNVCNQCNIYNYCRIKGCIMASYKINGDYNNPVNILCWIEKLKYKLAMEKKDQISLIFKSNV